MFIVNFLAKMPGAELAGDPEILREKKTSERSYRKHISQWLRKSFYP